MDNLEQILEESDQQADERRKFAKGRIMGLVTLIDRGEIREPKGILKKRCPLCNKRIKVSHFVSLYSEEVKKMYWYGNCSCGYEYGKYKILGLYFW